MSKKLWVFILSAIFVLSAIILGVTTVYRVDTVTVNATVVSDDAKEAAEELQQRLANAYNKNSIFFADAKEAQDIIKEFPNFRLISFKKSFPNRLIIEAKEDTELYAVPLADGSNSYYILDPSGIVLGVRDSYVNRLDGENNLLITGLTVTGEKDGRVVGDDYISSLITFCQKASEILDGIRRNVIRMTSSVEETFFRVNMREGVKIYIGYPMVMAEEKAEAAFEKYLSLSPEKRMKGRIAVSNIEGEIIESYAEKDDFAA